MVLTGLSHLAAADPTAMTVQAQAECLQALEQGDAISAAARARILVAFTAGQGYSADADYSPTSWLIHRTRITKGAARGHLGWARRAVAHQTVVAALAEGTVLSESMARTVCGWTDKLPAVLPRHRRRDPADRGPGRCPQGGSGRAGRGDLRPVPVRGRGRPGAGLRGPQAPGGDDLRRGRGHRGRPHPRMRGGGDRGAGGAVGPGGGGGHPDPGAAVPRRAGRTRCAAWSASGLLPERAGQPVKRVGARVPGRAAGAG